MKTGKENALLWTVGNCLLIDGFVTNRSIREHGQLRVQTILVPLRPGLNVAFYMRRIELPS